MNKITENNNEFQSKICQATKNLAIWTSAWLVTMAISTFGPIFLWPESKALSLTMIIINTLVGLMMILANKRHLESLDELQKKIQLEAMALTLGATLVVGLSYSALDTTNVISGDAEISVLVIFMGLTYFVLTLLGNARYK